MNHPDIPPAEQAHAEQMRAFAESAEAVDLLKQLNEGLIHPLEYADKIVVEAYKAGILPD